MKHSKRLIPVAFLAVLVLLPVASVAIQEPGIDAVLMNRPGTAPEMLITVDEQQYALSLMPAGGRIPVMDLVRLEAKEPAEQETATASIEAADSPALSEDGASALVLDAGVKSQYDVQYALIQPSETEIEYSPLIVVAAVEAEFHDRFYDEASDRVLLAALNAEATEEPAFMQDNGENGIAVSDPLEPVNRFFFHFNDKLYFWGIKPVSQVYGTLVPEWVRIRIRNMFFNITMPVRFVNSLLQFKPDNAAKEFGRFLVNSTAGVAGMFDIVADNPNVRPTEEDFGQTLGFHGLGNGMYLVWPLFGPSTVRDSFGMAGDVMLNPLTYMFPTEELMAVQGGRHVNNTSLQIGEYEDFKAGAIDPYISLRDAYIQHRRSKVKE